MSEPTAVAEETLQVNGLSAAPADGEVTAPQEMVEAGDEGEESDDYDDVEDEEERRNGVEEEEEEEDEYDNEDGEQSKNGLTALLLGDPNAAVAEEEEEDEDEEDEEDDEYVEDFVAAPTINKKRSIDEVTDEAQDIVLEKEAKKVKA